MSTPNVTMSAARAIYEYAGTDGLRPWEDLEPTVQISYVEEAEAALSVVSSYIKFLSNQVEVLSDEDYLVKGTMTALAFTLDPKTPELQE